MPWTRLERPDNFYYISISGPPRQGQTLVPEVALIRTGTTTDKVCFAYFNILHARCFADGVAPSMAPSLIMITA